MPNLHIITEGQEQASHVCTVLAQRGIYRRIWSGAQIDLEVTIGVIADHCKHYGTNCRLYFKMNETCYYPRQYTLSDYPDDDMVPMGYSEFIDTVAYNEG